MPILFADNFLAGSILTLVMPTVLLTLIAIWYVGLVKRVPDPSLTVGAKPPPPEVLAAADEPAAGPTADPPAAAS